VQSCVPVVGGPAFGATGGGGGGEPGPTLFVVFAWKYPFFFLFVFFRPPPDWEAEEGNDLVFVALSAEGGRREGSEAVGDGAAAAPATRRAAAPRSPLVLIEPHPVTAALAHSSPG